jgi:hypothetical protein
MPPIYFNKILYFQDYVSYRDVEFGTRFISSLIQVIDDHNDGIELLDLMKKVNVLLVQRILAN